MSPPPSSPRLSLREVRQRLADDPSPEAEAHWIARLREDPRSGAQQLATGLERRAAARLRESRRLEGLFALRARLLRQGARSVAGVDEVGVGPLAGPVVAAAVVLPERIDLPGLDDSKRLSAAARERLAAQIHAEASALCIAEATPLEIDRLNVLQASLRAMRRAVLGLATPPDHVLVDARTIPELTTPQTALIGGDGRDASIAAASIVAKVYRDALMRELDAEHPGYGLSQHKGYPTSEHLSALERLGPSPIHRRSFAPVARCAARP